jgi:hypothetical protein
MGPPGPDGHWPVWLTLLFHASNFLLFAIYLAIPAMKWYLWPYRGSGISNKQYWQIMAYMPMMALSRLARVLELWGPPYHLTTIVDVLATATACYSIYYLVHLIGHVMTLPSYEELSRLKELVEGLKMRETIRLERQLKRDVAIEGRLAQLKTLLEGHFPKYEVLVAIESIRVLLAGHMPAETVAPTGGTPQ